jgi:hypothetical protein
MCRLFDDNDFNSFIVNKAIEEDFSEVLVQQLRALRDLLTVYTEKETDEEIIVDPRWQTISKKAQEVMCLWKAERNPPFETVSSSLTKPNPWS